MTEIAIREEAPAQAGLTGRRWLFGSAVLDERTLELFVRGRQVELERKPLEVLLYLLNHAGEVVTKDDFAENLWPGRILTDTVLTRCISLLRQVLEDEDRTSIRTVHGYGYRLIARVKVEATEPLEPPKLDFNPGDSPPLRAQWRLVERLGAGGHGEAWLARHEKTGDRRVFKFAVDANALTSLKREITLYRLVHDSLGARAAVARILEWNLEEPPYFIEMEHVIGGNLLNWSDAQGGLGSMPLADRLDLGAQIAEALAAAHSVGALHKDLKPGNVLVHVDNGRPVLKLCDFGSGTVVDPARLEALGITRLGFTKTLSSESATPLYLAPEVIAGQPFTVQADIYSLGILLYQLVCGDLRRSLAPGWEADVEDELLREDIAVAAAGNPLKRLTDATQLAERLRSLEERRLARAAEEAAKARAERIRRVQAELRRTRGFALVLAALTCVAIASGIVAFRAREAALAASESADAISTFLMKDVLGDERTVERPQTDAYKASLDRAATSVDARFADRPAVAAEVHWLLGRRYQEIEQIEAATKQYEVATELFGRLHGAAAAQTLMGKERLATIYIDYGRGPEALALARELRDHWASSEATLESLLWRARAGRTMMLAGDVQGAESGFREILLAIPESNAAELGSTAHLYKQWIGYAPQTASEMQDALTAYVSELLSTALSELSDRYEEAELAAQASLTIYERLAGAESEQAAYARVRRGAVRIALGKYSEAEADLTRAVAFYDGWLPAQHAYRGIPRLWLARLRLEQQRPDAALTLAQQADRLCTTACPRRLRNAYASAIGEAYWRLGQSERAIASLETATAIADSLSISTAYREASRIKLAAVLYADGQPDRARDVLSRVNEENFRSSPRHITRADFLRIKGLLAQAGGNSSGAAESLEQAHAILNGRLGGDHWRTRQLRNDLSRLKNRAP
jgi:DNA-binding winged helix-turn-helix (wHTH) protein/predicted negative regulator of RcsB-dependent stress response/tRNA A-37 threonylcarbamoyl transferase component Bud32